MEDLNIPEFGISTEVQTLIEQKEKLDKLKSDLINSGQLRLQEIVNILLSENKKQVKRIIKNHIKNKKP